MNEPTHRNQLNLQQKFALFNFIKRHREPLCNPTSSNYKTLDEWAALAAAELNLPSLKPTVLSRYASVCGCPINTSLRRVLGSSLQNAPAGPGHMPPTLKPTIKYATLCAKVTGLEARLASLEAQLGIQQPQPRE